VIHENINLKSLREAEFVLSGIDYGITEYFHHSLMEFQKEYPEVFKSIEYDNENATKNKAKITDDDRACIYPHVSLDMELYQHAKEKFMRRVLGWKLKM
jgi:hypothetical protein